MRQFLLGSCLLLSVLGAASAQNMFRDKAGCTPASNRVQVAQIRKIVREVLTTTFDYPEAFVEWDHDHPDKNQPVSDARFRAMKAISGWPWFRVEADEYRGFVEPPPGTKFANPLLVARAILTAFVDEFPNSDWEIEILSGPVTHIELTYIDGKIIDNSPRK